MITVKEAIEKAVTVEGSKYRVAQNLGVQFTMLKNYLNGEIRSPQFKVCKALYDKYELIVFPYSEEELQADSEQTIMELG